MEKSRSSPEYLARLLEAVVADPGRRISRLPLLSEAEEQQLLVQWNDTAVAYPREQSLPELFARQVARTPGAIALLHEQRQVSYAELERRANQLGHYLRGLGVGPEVVVGLCIERSVEMVVGLLGILKAGGAYLPLDPHYPGERLGFMLEDARAPVVVTHGAAPLWLVESGRHQVCLARDRELIERQPATTPTHEGTAHNLCYVIYTSGSTGVPKGVAICRASVTNYLHFIGAQFGLGSHDTVLNVSSLSFDPSVRDIFGPLLHGSRLALMAEGAQKDLQSYQTIIERQKISRVLSIIPHVLDSLLQIIPAADTTLRDVFTCGEPLHYPTCVAFRQTLPASRLINQYGPTECTMVSSWFVADGSGDRSHAMPIGRPIWNASLYVFDDELELVPIGVVGELHIGGAGLARGYPGRPGLTAERFIAHPYRTGERLYRTGDRVRYRSDGNLEFVGRRDNQVKARGHRVELGEVEAALVAFVGVGRAVVVSRQDESGVMRLAGYVEARGEEVDAAALRAHLRRSLPEYMIPADLVVLDRLPLSPNGKVDRHSLPQPQERAGHVEPDTEAQKGLAAIWREVLKIERISAHDNFFDLGGHSLLAMQVVARVRNVFGVELRLMQLFETPMLAGLAGHIEFMLWSEANRRALRIESGATGVIEGTV